MTDSELLNTEIRCTVNNKSHSFVYDNDVEDLSQTYISVESILHSSRKLCEEFELDLANLTDRLAGLDYTLSDDRSHIILNMEKPDSSESEEEVWPVEEDEGAEGYRPAEDLWAIGEQGAGDG